MSINKCAFRSCVDQTYVTVPQYHMLITSYKAFSNGRSYFLSILIPTNNREYCFPILDLSKQVNKATFRKSVSYGQQLPLR
jgi:hypothetical protein